MAGKKFVFAPDSFKGSLSAQAVCHALRQAALAHFPEAQTVLAPVADGGEGTVEAVLLGSGGARHVATVTGPLGDPVEAVYGLLPDGSAVMELAACSGLPQVPDGRRDPLLTSSRGTGELIGKLLDQGVKKLLVGIGGSATNDGGMGMLMALGARFYDEGGRAVRDRGASLELVRRVDLSGLHTGVAGADITVICDVNNPLLGPTGATYIYGPQKGADEARLIRLEAGMENYARVFSAMGIDIQSFSGAGAAGGVGGALGGVLRARLRRGIDAVLDAIGFDDLIAGADLVVTGEGRIDRQSVEFFKVPAGVAARCQPRGIPVAALVGGIGEGAEAFYGMGGTAILSIVDGPMELSRAMSDAPRLMERACDRLFRLVKIGAGMN